MLVVTEFYGLQSPKIVKNQYFLKSFDKIVSLKKKKKREKTMKTKFSLFIQSALKLNLKGKSI